MAFSRQKFTHTPHFVFCVLSFQCVFLDEVMTLSFTQHENLETRKSVSNFGSEAERIRTEDLSFPNLSSQNLSSEEKD
jgi:hypothetical protein